MLYSKDISSFPGCFSCLFICLVVLLCGIYIYIHCTMGVFSCHQKFLKFWFKGKWLMHFQYTILENYTKVDVVSVFLSITGANPKHNFFFQADISLIFCLIMAWKVLHGLLAAGFFSKGHLDARA